MLKQEIHVRRIDHTRLGGGAEYRDLREVLQEVSILHPKGNPEVETEEGVIREIPAIAHRGTKQALTVAHGQRG